jgi:hypothetical protein
VPSDSPSSRSAIELVVQIQLLRNRPDLAEVDLDQVFKILPDERLVSRVQWRKLGRSTNGP